MATIKVLPFVAILYMASVCWGQALMGVDFGSHEVKIATIKNGAFDIVLNEASKRKSVNALGFDGETRIFGEGASNLRGRLPKQVILQAHHLLGVNAGAKMAEKFGSLDMPVQVVEDPARGGLQFDLGDKKLSPEEVVGHSIHYMAEMTKAHGKHAEVPSMIVAVPPHFTVQAREALRAAADIAGMRILSVVNDNTAVAVRYAQERAANAPDEKVLFIDVGAAFTSASAAYYTTVKGVPRVTVKSVAWDEELGGRHFDVRIANHLADAFDKETGFKIRENVKAYTKLLGAATKAKHTLSANDVTIVSIGSLMNDKDFSLKVTRTELDEICADLYSKIAAPVKKVLAETGLKVSNFDHVIPFGGGWRIPGLKKVLEEELVITKLETILNSDESGAFGAVFMHGNQSGLLRVKEVVLVDETTPVKAAAAPQKLQGAAMGTAKNRHTKMVEDEEFRKKKEAAKSGLEAWIYGIKEKMMEDDMEKVATEEEITEIKTTLDAGEEWLYDEGEEADIATYEAKKKEIDGKTAAVVQRYDELLLRATCVEPVSNRAASALSKSESWKTSRPQIPPSEHSKLERLAKGIQKLLSEGEAKLNGEGLRGPLPYTCADLEKKEEELKNQVDAMLLIKPKQDGKEL